MSPKMWAQESVTLHRRLGARKLLCVRNFGGELVEDNLKDYPNAPPVTMVSVSNGKIIRAEPIQQRYESGLVWHAKRMPGLEGEMNSWKPNSGLPSPGALDAMVIAVSTLFGIADYIHPEKPNHVQIDSRLGQRSAMSPIAASILGIAPPSRTQRR
jgi:phage terminase large subunit-like protein